MTLPKFGTSGLRGLVCDLTADLVQQYVRSFIAVCPVGAGVYIGHDLRASSPQLAQDVQAAVCRAGHAAYVCGSVTSPALAFVAHAAKSAAIMVTGSHIPADRNGLKFYSTVGEITKQQEAGISETLCASGPAAEHGHVVHQPDIMKAYNARYLATYAGTLQGMRIGVFEHSAVGRDQLCELLADIGATVIRLGRSDTFVPIDTEAVLPAFQHQFREWAAMYQLDAIVSTDADGDRPLLTDQTGKLVPGDILGQITARALGAKHVVTPISSNSGVLVTGSFETVLRTKIGSPYVLAGMAQLAGNLAGNIVGYEANGGFILGFQAGTLSPLMTRDALLPICAVLSLARHQGIAALVADEPARMTATGRLQNIVPSDANIVLAHLAVDPAARGAFLGKVNASEEEIDLTDGLRMSLDNGRTLHLRQSGNAPELRVYAEAGDQAAVETLLEAGMDQIREMLARKAAERSAP